MKTISPQLECFIQSIYEQNNYLIEYTNVKTTEKYAVIYFSSMGLIKNIADEYFKGNKNININKFEFFKTRIDKASKHIFLRDSHGTWYSQGINIAKKFQYPLR